MTTTTTKTAKATTAPGDGRPPNGKRHSSDSAGTIGRDGLCYESDVLEITAQVMTWDTSLGGWVTVAGGGISTVKILKQRQLTCVRLSERSLRMSASSDTELDSDVFDDDRQAPDSPNTSGQLSDHSIKEFVVRAHRSTDRKLVMECVLSSIFKYNRASPTFHHWQCAGRKFGLTFSSSTDALLFEKTMQTILEQLKQKEACRLSLKHATAPVGAARSISPSTSTGDQSVVTVLANSKLALDDSAEGLGLTPGRLRAAEKASVNSTRSRLGLLRTPNTASSTASTAAGHSSSGDVESGIFCSSSHRDVDADSSEISCNTNGSVAGTSSLLRAATTSTTAGPTIAVSSAPAGHGWECSARSSQLIGSAGRNGCRVGRGRETTLSSNGLGDGVDVEPLSLPPPALRGAAADIGRDPLSHNSDLWSQEESHSYGVFVGGASGSTGLQMHDDDPVSASAVTYNARLAAADAAAAGHDLNFNGAASWRTAPWQATGHDRGRQSAAANDYIYSDRPVPAGPPASRSLNKNRSGLLLPSAMESSSHVSSTSPATTPCLSTAPAQPHRQSVAQQRWPSWCRRLRSIFRRPSSRQSQRTTDHTTGKETLVTSGGLRINRSSSHGTTHSMTASDKRVRCIYCGQYFVEAKQRRRGRRRSMSGGGGHDDVCPEAPDLQPVLDILCCYKPIHDCVYNDPDSTDQRPVCMCAHPSCSANSRNNAGQPRRPQRWVRRDSRRATDVSNEHRRTDNSWYQLEDESVVCSCGCRDLLMCLLTLLVPCLWCYWPATGCYQACRRANLDCTRQGHRAR